MTKKRHPLTIAVITGLAVTLTLVLFSYSILYKRFKYAANDFRWKQCAQKSLADPDIVIVAIDDYSINHFSEKFNYNWPWPRQFYGIILDYFKKAGANVVVFDMLFSQSEVGRIDIDGSTSEKEFADAMVRFKNVILGQALREEVNLKTNIMDGKNIVFENADKMPLKAFNSVETPIRQFLDSAGGTGVVNFHTDEDGVSRRLPLIFKVGGKYYPQLSFAAYLMSAKDSVIRYEEKTNTLQTLKTRFKLDKNGYYQIYWHGPGGGEVYRYDSFYNVFISATQLMAGKTPVIPLKEYEHKKVVLCATASGLMDLKVTPFSSTNAPYPGGEIHTTLFDNLINGRHVKTVPDNWIIIFSLILTILLSYAYITKSLALSLSFAVLATVSVMASSFYFFKNHVIHMEFIFPVLAILLTSAASAMYKMLTEGLAKRQIRNIFSRYLHEDVINLLMENPDTVDLKGTGVVGTVLFTDLQGFTTFAEDKTPHELIEVLNNYFEIITDIVLDQGGMLDKYTGDGIMAIFGAPIEREGHAKSACETILSFRERSVNELISSSEGNILTRIGISSGPIVVGNLGSHRRMDFTAIGDTVNLSARLEGVNKAYGTTNIMSEYTWYFVKDDYYFRELDYIRVKGKNRPIRVFTLVNRHEAMGDEAIAIEEMFQDAISIYRERRWQDASDMFKKVLERNPEDSPSQAYIERCKLLKTSPDLVDDQGVFTFKTK